MTTGTSRARTATRPFGLPTPRRTATATASSTSRLNPRITSNGSVGESIMPSALQNRSSTCPNWTRNSSTVRGPGRAPALMRAVASGPKPLGWTVPKTSTLRTHHQPPTAEAAVSASAGRHGNAPPARHQPTR